MIRVIVLALFTVLCCQSYAQSIVGNVYQEGTNNAITGASVYYNGSTTGTLTNNQGLFYLQAKSGQVPLVISSVGYYSTEVTSYKPGELLKIYLKPRQMQLQGVIVKFDGMTRAEKVRIFTREFVGTSKYSAGCKIVNIDDVDLYYNAKTKTLTGECSKPIHISNKALGYSIAYYLDGFKYSPQGVQYSGNSIFKDIHLLSADKSVKRNREQAYDGSRMQLIRLLWHGKAQNSIYKLYNDAYKPLDQDSIIMADLSQDKYLNPKSRVWIAQETSKGLVGSWITPGAKPAFINKEGFYGAGLKWGGKLAQQRIGDLLPFEYQSAKEETPIQAPTANDNRINKAFGVNNGAIASKGLPEAAAQQLALFKTIVLGEEYLGSDAAIVKWEEPIYYKVYGSSGMGKYDVTLSGYVDQFFARLATLTGLTIKPATDSLLNFFIVLGSVDSVKDKLMPEALTYFASNPTHTGYFTHNDAGLTSMTQRVFLDELTLQLVWLQVRAQILSGLGFNGTIKSPKRSLFFFEPYYWTPDKPMEAFDEQIIRMLYMPEIKYGMQAPQLDVILKSKSAADVK